MGIMMAWHIVIHVMSYHAPCIRFQPFSGPGHRLSHDAADPSEPQPPTSISSTTSTTTTSQPPQPPMTREQFLSRLPESTISNGKVIDIRHGIGKLLGKKDKVCECIMVCVVRCMMCTIFYVIWDV